MVLMMPGRELIVNPTSPSISGALARYGFNSATFSPAANPTCPSSLSPSRLRTRLGARSGTASAARAKTACVSGTACRLKRYFPFEAVATVIGPRARLPKRTFTVEVLRASRKSAIGAGGLNSLMPFSSKTPGAASPALRGDGPLSACRRAAMAGPRQRRHHDAEPRDPGSPAEIEVLLGGLNGTF